MANEKYLVTGAAGFIGFNLVERLLAQGADVRAIDNFSTGLRENEERLKRIASTSSGRLTFVEGDLREMSTCVRILRDVDYVLHQAAWGSVPRSIRDPEGTNENNVTATLHVLWAAKGARVKRFVFASSSSVYGNCAELPKHEGLRLEPVSPYAVSKMACEAYCRSFRETFNVPTIALRYFNVFGPHQRPDGPYAAVVPKFIDAMLSRRTVKIYGDGQQSRDFTHVSNVVEANLNACRVTLPANVAFNIGCGESMTISQLAHTLERFVCSEPASIIHEAPRPGDVRHSCADIGLARTFLMYQPRVDATLGLGHTASWFKARQEE